MNCNRCGKWAGAHATLPGQPKDHLCMCMPVAPQHYTVPMSDDRVRLLVREELQRLGLLVVRDPVEETNALREYLTKVGASGTAPDGPNVGA